MSLVKAYCMACIAFDEQMHRSTVLLQYEPRCEKTAFAYASAKTKAQSS